MLTLLSSATYHVSLLFSGGGLHPYPDGPGYLIDLGICPTGRKFRFRSPPFDRCGRNLSRCVRYDIFFTAICISEFQNRKRKCLIRLFLFERKFDDERSLRCFANFPLTLIPSGSFSPWMTPSKKGSRFPGRHSLLFRGKSRGVIPVSDLHIWWHPFLPRCRRPSRVPQSAPSRRSRSQAARSGQDRRISEERERVP